MSNSSLDKIALLSLNGNRPLAKRISDYMGIPLLDATVSHFSDGEINIQMNESIRGKDVYIIHSVSDPVNDNFMELMIAVDALRRASANSITCVLPYFAYTRSDRKSRSREPISAKLFANMLELGSVDRVIALDMHADQIQGFFDIPVDHLRAMPIFASYFEKRIKNPDEFVFVAPDHNSTKRARALAEVFGSQIAIVDQRSTEDENVVPDIIGDVDGKQCVIVDDLIDTGTRMINSAEAVKVAGAKTISAVATHPIFSKDAAKRLEASDLMQVLVSDSIVVPEECQFDKLKILSVTDLVGDTIRMSQLNESIDSLFNVRDSYTEIK
ncbi:ribose-phosphate pyrophosphokinase [Companilactobacillus crustorum]|uniref:Ribose-phosphate pyrophosphokinase n=3 Tax=Companilactobacillus TaxID=2767879 RepID=A0A837RI18_9LACO|nr:ribose-phosphate pyrophosphokinase [Companilactobacillus crustorum]APU70611.1 Ribose-phosphate pyrophosphokinase 2 [Companilactobacillus crustorum]KRK43260.1 ribose-phosphate pyrophosphokinase [Companilactobacillus crustorum JCM 15951]KRO20841.1 ribose-phosphate pyrophosphokinase [Companilactobacillus crustorum]WDT65232.1 ribose-phosphate pyrophosphokinase [Companilactobacillus crustorum]GEO76290.1 ribose-phosphate pyrophosphokinase [Companilactobacillus crustorum]